MFTVFPAASFDGPAVQKIACDIPYFTAEERECIQELWTDFLENDESSPYRFCVCRDQETNRVAGFACYGKHALTMSTYDLYWIAVDPAVQRSGVGSVLLSYVEEQVSTREGSCLLIETSNTKPYLSARKFYNRHNYHKEALLRDFYAPGDHLIIFSKRLNLPRIQSQPDYMESDLARKPDLRVRGDNKWYD